MCALPRGKASFFRIYDPAFLENHEDTTDFDCCATTKIIIPHEKKRKKKKTKKNNVPQCRPLHSDDCLVFTNESNDKLLQSARTRRIISGRHSDDIDNDIRSTYQSSAIQKVNSKTNLHAKTNPAVTLSKWSLLKNKLIPRVSSIFRINYKHRKQHEENETEMLSPDCELNCAKYQLRRMRKNKRDTTQSVYYTIEGNLQVPVQFGATQVVQVPLNGIDKVLLNQFSNCSLTSSSESGELTRDKDKAKNIFKRRMKKEFTKEYLKYLTEKNVTKNQSQQYSKHDPCQIFNSSSHSERKNNITTTTQDYDFYHDNIPSSSSEFWDSLFDNLNKKYETQQRTETVYADYEKKIDPRCCCKNCQVRSQKAVSPPRIKSPPPGARIGKKVKKTDEVVECKCKSKTRPQAKLGRPINKLLDEYSPKSCQSPISMSKQALKSGVGATDGVSDESCRPCQQPHDKIAKSAQNKYKGEIICIHNPPCVLINGCLNLPSIQPAPLNVFASTENKNSGNICSKMTSPLTKNNCEQACQHHPSCIEFNMQQCQTSIYRTDKEIQSTCIHNPPCEVVRGCFKPKYEPILEDSAQTLNKKSPLSVEISQSDKKPRSSKSINKSSNIIKGNKIREEIKAKRSTKLKEVQAAPNYDPKLDNYCVHVPMCQKQPECHDTTLNLHAAVQESNSEVPLSTMDYLAYKDIIGAQERSDFHKRSEKSCGHTPMCHKLPKCVIRGINQRVKRDTSPMFSENFVAWTTTEDISTQANQGTDDKQDSYCFHIPTCQKQPECLTNGKSLCRSCDHRPKCSDVPVCQRNLLTAKGDVSTQVKPKSKFICRHDPRCIMIPKCLSSAIQDGFVPLEGIPECRHRPCCDLIPACCRKPAKETASVSSQYPASCRIV